MGLIAALVAVVLGVFGLRRARPRKWLAALTILLGAAAAFPLAALWQEVRHGQMEPMLRARCATNLSSIRNGLVMYSSEHEDLYPEQLHVLVRHGLISVDTLECPSVDEEDLSDGHYVEVTDPELREQLADGLVDGRYRCDYFYLPPMERYPDVPATTIVACDLRGNHEDGRNVLYAYAHVQWCEEDDLQRELDKPVNRRFAEALREHEGR